MRKEASVESLLMRIRELETRLADAEQLIEAIKSGEVDAFAINKGSEAEIFTLQSGDYAYRVLIEEFREGAINVTEDGLIVYTNAYFSTLLKMPYERVIGSSVFDFVDPDSREEFNRLFTESLTGNARGEINLLVGDIVTPVYVSLTSLRPKLATVGIIITDFTEKRKNERIILEYQRDLESNNLKLIERNTELASFAYIASHDLQEPLRKIQTFVSRLLEKDYENISEKGKVYFDRMQIAAIHMQQLIDDLLTYSRTTSVERIFEITEISGIINEVTLDLKEELNQKKGTIETTGSGRANIIPFQFRQLLYNLISNSIKFSNRQLPPYIKIKSEVAKGKELANETLLPEVPYCHISIADNGIGFEQQYSEKIFELFQRLNAKSEYNGTGIGLAIVKKIVENHSGIITATAELNKGAIFDIYIPSRQ